MTTASPPPARFADPGASVRTPWSLPVAAGLFCGWILLSQGLRFFELWPGGSAWYPPAALVAAACIVWGWRAIPPLLLGAATTWMLVGQGAYPLWRVALSSAALKGAYWLGAWLLRKLRFDPTFAQPVDVACFAVVMTLSSLLAASVGVADAVLLGVLSRAQAVRSVRVFMAGDLVAVLALAPMLLAGARLLHDRHARQRRDAGWRLGLWGTLQLLAVPVSLLFALGAAPRLGFLAYGACFLPLGWIALTHGVGGAAVMSGALAIGAIVTRQWWGATRADNLELQTFIASLAITGLLLGSVTDQRERARRLLAESEERYRALVELLPDPLLVHRAGRILFANAAAAKTLGSGSPAALIGLPLTELATGEALRVMRERLATLAAGEPTTLLEYRLIKRDGSGPVDVESVSIPISYDGKPSALTVARDVTARKRLAEELRHAQRLETVGRLAGGVAHDFNNLISVVLSYSELMLLELPESSPLREYAQETLSAARRGSALTRQLLTFSRKQVVQPARVHLDGVVRDTEAMLRRLIGSHVAMRFSCGSTGVVLADQGQLEQVIVNLAINARDAMPGGGELSVETGRASLSRPDPRWPGLETGEYATVLVGDSGVGMSAEVRAHIFEPFFTTKEQGQGTGLGLATVHGIIKQARGSIFVESAPGAGTLFAIFLPRVGEDAGPRTEQPAAPVPPPAARAARVLLVEDNAAVRAATRRVLESEGYSVVEAVHGRAALEQLDSGALVDLILSDVSMPEMGGRQLAQALRERGETVPILLISGFADADETEGSPRVLQKPLTASVLTAAIAQALRKPGRA